MRRQDPSGRPERCRKEQHRVVEVIARPVSPVLYPASPVLCTRAPGAIPARAISGGANTETKQMEKITHLEALMFSAVLESCVDQLTILGYIMPVPHKDKTDINHVCATAEKEVYPIFFFFFYCCVPFLPGRQYASDVITVTIKKMEELGTFSSLTDANEREKARKGKFYDILIRSVLCSVLPCLNAESHSHSVHVQKEIKHNKLQETTAIVDTENNYMKKNTDLQIQLTQKKCSSAENALEKEIQNLKSKIDEEIQLHMETENFLMQEYQKVKEKLEYWIEKYQKDTAAKDEELDDLRALKAENLETMQRFAKEVRHQHLNVQPCKTALGLSLPHFQVQAWWKGTMVRRFLGPYQELEKYLKGKGEKETGKEKSGAKKKRAK
uniref:IQ motif containing G n=1 Tax=Serinus canaria TaxID=9135 RepID=A0A8C9NPH7_SERCA